MKKLLLRGSITPALIVMTGAFVVVIYGLLLVLSTQLDYSHRQVASEMSINIAEAGINYYRWHLAHAPEDFQDGTGAAGPYVHEYVDPEGLATGKYSLDITPPVNGSSIVTIRSTGWADRFPNVKRSVTAQYGKPSLARYSFLVNASSWYGTGLTVNGEIHSNNGIRMDAVNTSVVSSVQTTYPCGSETGCNPAPQTKPGVWGGGSGSALWQFPVPPVSFAAIAFDFDAMQDAAIADGHYLGASGFQGYHIIFNANGTYQVRRVNTTNYYDGYTPDDLCQRRYQRIATESNVGTYNVSDNPIIFAEDRLWVEGVVKGKITVVAVRFPLETNNMDIWIPNNLTYVAYDQTNNLGLVAQRDIYFARNIPEAFRVDGALLAQKGKIIRHGYISGCGFDSTHSVKDSLTLNGSIISYNKSYWNFGSSPSSGFITRTINYDASLLLQPPPYFPTSGDYEFITWKEE